MKTLRIFFALNLESRLLKNPDRQYLLMSLEEANVAPDPFRQFDLWYGDAENSGIDLPNAFTLSTASTGGVVSSRVLLLKSFNESGFVFYTNSLSRKGKEMGSNPRASICFFWSILERQVRIEGGVETVDDKEADDYFSRRPRESRIGAWASPQGKVVSGREELEEMFARREAEFKDRSEIPRPPFWKGYRIIPSVFEFWQGRRNRMHDRIKYRLNKKSDGWIIERLAP